MSSELELRTELILSLDATTSKLNVLYAKQGRSRQFPTQAARDAFLKDEIKSLEKHEKAQQKQIDSLTTDLDVARTQSSDADKQCQDLMANEDDRRENVRKMAEESSRLKRDIDEMQEHKKYVALHFGRSSLNRDMWREDAKLGQTVSNARAEMQGAERSLAGMMDKVRNRVQNPIDQSGYQQRTTICQTDCEAPKFERNVWCSV